jgi:hypothetical protein
MVECGDLGVGSDRIIGSVRAELKGPVPNTPERGPPNGAATAFPVFKRGEPAVEHRPDRTIRRLLHNTSVVKVLLLRTQQARTGKEHEKWNLP